jgi:hypothetical protein
MLVVAGIYFLIAIKFIGGDDGNNSRNPDLLTGSPDLLTGSPDLLTGSHDYVTHILFFV